MKRFISIAIFALLTMTAYAQVGIGTRIPDASAQLDIVADDRGLLIPRLDIADLSTAAPVDANEIEVSLLVYNTNTTTGVGYYYWDGTQWQALMSDTSWFGTDDDSRATENNENIYHLGDNIGMGTDKPDASARLDIKAIDKGLLIPRLDIADLNTPAPVDANEIEVSLLVYNTNTISGVGYYYWDGTRWETLASSPWFGTDSDTSATQNTEDIYHLGKKVGIGTDDPGAGFVDVGSNGYVLDVAGHIWQTKTGNSVFIGEQAGANDDLSDNRNVFVGKGAGKASTKGEKNTALGYQALYKNTLGKLNTAVGWGALFNNTSDWNTAVGAQALSKNTTAGYNTAVGYQALNENTVEKYNTAVGYQALFSNNGGGTPKAGLRNTALGYRALYTNTQGFYNTGIGYQALNENTTGNHNTAVGGLALGQNDKGSGNIAVGHEALYNNKPGTGADEGKSNTALGYKTLYNLTTGSSNTAVGHNTGQGLEGGYENTILGANVTIPDAQKNINRNIFIADGAGTVKIRVLENGDVGIGTQTPRAPLEVSGTSAIIVPAGITTERPGTAVDGMIRYNTTTKKFEGYADGVWVVFH